MAKRPQYSVLQGLIRDLERALEESGTVEWKLLSTFDNLLFAIEEADLAESHDSADVEDASDDDADEASDGGDACGPLFQGTAHGESPVGTDVPRGTLQRNSVPVPLVGAVPTPVKRVNHTGGGRGTRT